MTKHLLLFLLLNLAAEAANISWSGATNVSAASDVSTNGSLVEAFNLGGIGGVTNETVNSVLFTAKTNLLNSNATQDTYSGTTGDAGYDDLISTIDFGGGTNTVSLSVGNGSLAVGASYEIQVWFVDDRFLSPVRVTPVGDSNGNAVSLSSAGQFSTGVFTADATSQTITLESPGFGNAHLNAYQIRILGDEPVATLTTPNSTVAGTFTVNVSFSEAVTGLSESDFSVTNGTLDADSLSGSGASYTFTVTPNGNGDISTVLAAHSVTDVDGDNDQNLFPATLNVTFNTNLTPATLIDYVECVSAPYNITAHFGEQVSGLTLSDFSVTNAVLSGLTNHNDGNYTVTVTPTVEGIISLTLPANSVTGNSSSTANSISNTLTTEYSLSPKVTIYGPLSSTSEEVEVFFTFQPNISGFTASDIVVSNGSVTSLTMQGRREFSDRYYKATIKAATPGNITVSVPTGNVSNANAPNRTNTASNLFTLNISDDFGDHWLVDTAAEWTASESSSTNLTLAGGYAEPSANSSTFSSVLKTYPARKQATRVTFTQSAVWDNWIASENISPSGAGNAPIFLPLANDDYYFFGENANNAYHAWHSTDMATWTHLGQVTNNNDKWCTTVEHKDGTFYIFVDTPNDHTPTLYTDTNLADGIPGTNHGIIFYDPTDGSDSSIFRDNADGRFHIISEDWSPVRANTHSFDSPLATHASAADALDGFIFGQHLPPIDVRSTPTGTFGSYNHPHLAGSHRSNPQVYEIHSGGQDAFGDWTSIKVGDRYYMFSDYEHHDGSPAINTGRFVSDSIYDEFVLVGDLGNGHPDPTCGFAEGQFYLITQQNTDYTSPGPWVDGVEARAGVDTNNDGAIDQWTAWLTIQESYDHTPGYARVVTTTPAEIDLSTLPAGYGFQFEFRVDNTVVSGVSPIMDKVEMCFVPSHFQQWANTQGTPAVALDDHNNNGVSNLIEFALGEDPHPQIASDNSLTYNLSSGAVADGVIFNLQYSEDLMSWLTATNSTPGVSLLSINPHPSGDSNYLFDLDLNNFNKLFWRPSVTLP